MKYLQYRQEFLDTKVELDMSKFSNYLSNSKMINEVYESDITWGGSLIGRLINSTIRKINIVRKRTQIPSVLKDLKRELDYLVTCSLQGELKTKVDLLRIKGFMEQIKDQCFRPSGQTSDEEDILKELLGSGYNPSNYDPKNPKAVRETSGLVQGLIDALINDFPDLEKMIGINRKILMDSVSNFNQELRKYYYQLKIGDPGGDTLEDDSSLSTFKQNFGNIYQALMQKQKTTTSSSF